MKANVSLLKPLEKQAEGKDNYIDVSDNAVRDLDLGFLLRQLSIEETGRMYKPGMDSVHAIFKKLCLDKSELYYRQDVFRDFWENYEIRTVFLRLLPKMQDIRRLGEEHQAPQPRLFILSRKLGLLESFVELVEDFSRSFAGLKKKPVSRGLQAFTEEIERIRSDEIYMHLKAELPRLLANVRNIKGVTIGVNLDDNLLPVEACLLSINKKRFKDDGPHLFNRLFGTSEQRSGLAGLHTMRNDAGSVGEQYGGIGSPLMVPLFRDLADVLDKSCLPLEKELRAFSSLNIGVFNNIFDEVLFLLSACGLFDLLKKSKLPVSYPEFSDAGSREAFVEDSYNINLALRMRGVKDDEPPENEIVLNDIKMTRKENILLITGPNRGGKTTYVQSAGLIFLLAQIGLPVPARSAHIGLVEGIYSHFPREERPESHSGRLGEEIDRMNAIFETIQPNSLLLLNEPLQSTSAAGSYHLASDVIRVLKKIGIRTLFSTHLHELARGITEMNNAENGEGRIISLVARVDTEPGKEGGKNVHVQPTFKILPGIPAGRSYSEEIARKYGFSYDKLLKVFKKRGMLI